jgi:hypothetical protein
MAAPFLYNYFTQYDVPIQDQLVIFLTVISHFPLELPVHRAGSHQFIYS